MRVNIKTNGNVADRDLKALVLINFALNLCHERMILPTLQFFADRYGCRIVRK